MRQEKTLFKWVKGHKGHKLNEGADKLAGMGAWKNAPDVVTTNVGSTLKLTGAKLAIMTQKLAYQGIREVKMRGYEPLANNIKVFFRETPADAQLWKGIRHKDIRWEIRYLLWMTMHDAYMEEMKQRHECSVCGVPETMDHILTKCEVLGQNKLWDKKSKLWLRPSIRAVLSCPIAPFC
ncbi:hypothetical protein DAEQUDRAFT_777190 [Daedalea quercina L-15889]|uniref:RNase H type-1 domain-containing protein n=1 Tax=Daedalea quercina L-15889 TaxID=1314783 RepID=A0A165KWH6_9APHY|nr:hypothetical protein DAEQUDRAFT_777190 [Daedalea quercina L-15889]